jgi:hypothetical protein
MQTANPAPLALVSAATTAQKMLDAAICAYAIGPGGYAPSPFYDGPVGWVGTPSAYTDGSDAIDAALLGQTSDGWAVLSLRGTISSYDSFASFFAFIEDWLQDDETTLVPLISPSGTNLGNVHQGFLNATMALWNDVYQQLLTFDWSSPNGLSGLRITGHSKGAGMAFLFAALINAEMGLAGPKMIEVHGFAAPLAGDPAFATAYNNAGLGQNTTRYQAAYDLVPFLPPYTTFDLFEHIDLWHIRYDFELDAALLYLADTVTTGYELVGSLEYYPSGTSSDPFPAPITGQIAQWQAQADILAAIQAGEKDIIAAAHSATNSYWPAVFGQNPPMLPLGPLAAAYFAAFQAQAQAASAGD